MKLSEFTDHKTRRESLERELRTKLPTIDHALVDDTNSIHCENLIGATSIPLGVAGPLDVIGDEVRRPAYVPLATTEGALVASVSRGCKALNEAGGARVNVYKTGTTRGPVFYTESVAHGQEFLDWAQEHVDEIVKEVEKTSSHILLTNLEAKLIGSYAYLRLYFDTSDAMGMNMVTIATQAVIDYVEKNTKVRSIAIAGNFDVDKKAAWLNSIYGRGFQGWADVVIPENTLKKTLKASAEQIFDVWLAKCMIGSAISGSMGFNAQFANVVAAIFAATGQDLAHVVEGSLGITTMKVINGKNLYVSVYLPSLMVGTVGGGTQLTSKKEALSIMGVKSVAELAEIITGAVLAGEVSLLASLAEGSLAKAHEKLGR
ncbi:hydroxymethylglutaryl-CoA reductase [Candidatus Microgenomates bacterium]|nr:hydroxymethylglutaryl-CoA reductase [Candidatus Microgenomates bacterium]